ncbi:NAD(P)-binding protein [Pholiota molesta]|nr:NAD(P)-binding protein [Pholiota molesta]
MSEISPKIYFVAGATRGLGLALVDDIATKGHSAVIYAGARDPSNGAAHLIEVAAKYPGRVHVVKYVAGDKEGNDALAKQIAAEHGRLDTVIANAAICATTAKKVHETPADKFADEFSVNALGPIVLFQSTRELLKASPLPRFVPISSASGSMELIPQLGAMDASPYGASKAALNWVTRKIHFENEWLIAFPQCPGPMNTDMVNDNIAKQLEAAEADKVDQMRAMLDTIFLRPSAAAGKLVDIIAASTREKDGGQFHNIDDGRHPW